MPIPSAEAPSRRLLRDVIHHKLAEAILAGQLMPGERLHDDEIGAWLGASRTPIREAMFRLQREGLVEISSNRHTKVASPNVQDAREAIEHLEHLLAAARSYSGNLVRRDCDRILSHVDALVLDTARPEQELEKLWDLHAPLVRASGNRMFKAAVHEAHMRAQFALRTNPEIGDTIDRKSIGAALRKSCTLALDGASQPVVATDSR